MDYSMLSEALLQAEARAREAVRRRKEERQKNLSEEGMALEAEREARKRREEEEERQMYPPGMLSAALLEAEAKALEGRRRREEEEEGKYLSEEALEAEAEAKIFDYKLSNARLVAEARAREAVRRREEEERWKKLAALPPVTDGKEKKQMFDICVAYGFPPFPLDGSHWGSKAQAMNFKIFPSNFQLAYRSS
ncbi:hypothetical protein OROMI_028080 [Orobanche minor]